MTNYKISGRVKVFFSENTAEQFVEVSLHVLIVEKLSIFRSSRSIVALLIL